MRSLKRLSFAVITAFILSAYFSSTHTALAQSNGSSGILISEFRLDGPNGAGDEFVEIVNNNSAPFTIISSDVPATDGWSVWGMVGTSAVKICTIPHNTILAPGQHFLCAKSPGYELGGYSKGQDDISITPPYPGNDLIVDGGVALFSSETVTILVNGTWLGSFGNVNREDAVGFKKLNLVADEPSFAPAFREGMGLNPIGPQNPTSRAGAELREYSFVRKHGIAGNGSWSRPTYHDSNNNAVDFALVANIGDGPVTQTALDNTPGTLFAATAFDPSLPCCAMSEEATLPVFGAPGPQSMASPIERNYTSHFIRSAFDTGSAIDVSPNRERNSQIFCGAPRGDLILRFTYRNQTTAIQNNLRVRWIDLSTVNRTNANFASVITLLDSTAATRQVAVINGRDIPANDPAPSGDGIVNANPAGGLGVKTVSGTFVEGVDKTPQVLGYAVTSPSAGNFTAFGNQNFRQVNPTLTDTGGTLGTPCRVGGFNSATVATPPTGAAPGVTTAALPAPLVPGGSISLEHRFGVIRQGQFLIVGIIESN